MLNYFTDNQDLQFTLKSLELAEISALLENDYRDAEKFENAPRDFADAMDNYERSLKVIGEIAAERIEARSREVDLNGAKFKDGYTVADPSVLGNGSWLTTKHLRYLSGAIVGHGDLPMRDLIHTVVHSDFAGDMLIEFEGMEDPRIACALSLNNLRSMIELEK